MAGERLNNREPATSVGIATTWWSRQPPTDNLYAQRAIKFGNDPDVVARRFAAVSTEHITCRVCGLWIPFCTVGGSTRCYERPDTGMTYGEYGCFFGQEIGDGRDND